MDNKMGAHLTPEQISRMELLANVCKMKPSILHKPELAFMKSLIEHFGGKIPKPEPESTSEEPKPTSTSEESKPADEVKETEPTVELKTEEVELDLDMSGVIEPDFDPPQKMGNPTLQPTDDEIAESQAKRSEAVSAFVEKDYERAIELYTEAIILNPQAVLLYAKRGQVFLSLNKPNACIRDCDRALELNPDSAAAHKFRGRAYYLLGKFEEAANDLRLACKFDFDEQADEWLREVTPNVRKIEEHKRMKERQRQEKLEKERQEKLAKARETAKAYEDNTRPSQTEQNNEFVGDFSKFRNDPDVIEAFKDPEMTQAFQEILSNHINIFKYQNNPKVMSFIIKMVSKFSGAGLFPGMMPGMPGFPSADAGPSATPDPKSQDDVGLD